jgi:hypothetical protein
VTWLVEKCDLVEVTLKCQTCLQTMKAMMEMPGTRYPKGSAITLNVVRCPFDTEEGRQNLMKGVSLHYEREVLNQR